jgi:hypothetical protein
MIDTSELMSDSDFCENFSVLRTTGGQFGPGGYIPVITAITLLGAVQMADAVSIEQIPEGDRQNGARLFWSAVQLYETNEEGLSDVIVYHSFHWKVVKVWDRSANGFWKAFAVQLEAA